MSSGATYSTYASRDSGEPPSWFARQGRLESAQRGQKSPKVAARPPRILPEILASRPSVENPGLPVSVEVAVVLVAVPVFAAAGDLVELSKLSSLGAAGKLEVGYFKRCIISNTYVAAVKHYSGIPLGGILRLL